MNQNNNRDFFDVLTELIQIDVILYYIYYYKLQKTVIKAQ